MSSNCLRCGRPLKSKISSKRGYGPSCYEKMMSEKEPVVNVKEKEISRRIKNDEDK